MPDTSNSLRILIIGGGGREHALYWKLSQSPMAEAIYVMPGNAGIPSFARIKGIDLGIFSAIKEVIVEGKIDLVIIGPEQPLVDGLGNYLAEMVPNVLFFGPSKEAAQLEGSKLFCKMLCEKYSIPTAQWAASAKIDQAKEIVVAWGVPTVIKADGLCAGKGVTIALTLEAAYEALENLLVKKVHRNAGELVIIEDVLIGKECSIMALCDGEDIIMMEPVRDHKRLRAGPEGPDNPNTGGMGAYSPIPDVDTAMQQQIRVEILEPLVRAMKAEGCMYKGVIFAGIMVTKEGPMLLEVNCRFGDPETQTLMPRLNSDLLPYLIAVASGTLEEMEPLEWSSKYSVCVNKVSGGYPAASFPKGFKIEGLFDAAQYFHAEVFHAGTELEDDKFITAGGRVLSFVGNGRNMREAADNAYEAAQTVHWDGAYQRSDIGRYKTYLR